MRFPAMLCTLIWGWIVSSLYRAVVSTDQHANPICYFLSAKSTQNGYTMLIQLLL